MFRLQSHSPVNFPVLELLCNIIIFLGIATDSGNRRSHVADLSEVCHRQCHRAARYDQDDDSESTSTEPLLTVRGLFPRINRIVMMHIFQTLESLSV